MSLLETLSAPLGMARAHGNSLATTWCAGVTPLVRSPWLVLNDGVWPAADGGNHAPNRLFLLPYGEGPAGTSFSLRVFGWRELGRPNADVNALVWIPFLLAELSCRLCNQAGPAATAPGVPTRNVLDSERFCDTISLTQGVLGPWYTAINSTGPGTDLIAWALVDLVGCRYFSFDFQQQDLVGMNCLWARA